MTAPDTPDHPSRRTVMTALGLTGLLAGAHATAAQPAQAAPRDRRRVHSVTAYGAVGDGVTDDTAAFQAAIDAIAEAGGGTLLVPPRTYVLAPVTPVVLRADDMTVEARGATFRRPYRKPRPSVMFAANTRGTPGYGAGVRNLVWRGGRFVGNLAEDNAICPFGLHHAQDCLFEGIVSENCHAAGSHQFDLGGCDNITVRHCTFRGQAWTETAGGEAIQVDASYRGTLSGGTAQSGFSGLLSRGITVEHCTFEPFTDADGTVWPGPTPMGNHFAIEGQYYEDIRFAHNHVTDPRTSILFGDHRDTWRGAVHFISVHGLQIVGNQFTMTESRQTRVIAANSIGWGMPAGSDPADPESKRDWEVPNDCADVLIADNVINGFSVKDGVDQLGAIVVLGMPDGRARDVTIRGNTVSGGYRATAGSHGAGIEIAHATDALVDRNTVEDYYLGIDLTTVSDSVVRGNPITNTTGTTFPAAIVARDVTDTAIRPGPTSGYAVPVERV